MRHVRPQSASAILIACLGASVLAQTPTPPQQPIFRDSVSVVTVDAYPQRDGKIVEGLKADDFEVLEDGQPQKIVSFEFVRVDPKPEDGRVDPLNLKDARAQAADPRLRVFAVFLDTYHVTVEGSHRARQPLISMLDSIVGPRDLFGVTTQRLKPSEITFGRRTLSVADQLTKNWAWGDQYTLVTEDWEKNYQACFWVNPVTGAPIMFDEGPRSRLLLDVLADRRKQEISLAALDGLVVYLGQLREARTSLVLFSNGWVPYTPDQALKDRARQWMQTPSVGVGPGGRLTTIASLDDRGSSATCAAELLRVGDLDTDRRLRDLITHANQANVTFYPIAADGLAAFDTPNSQRQDPSFRNRAPTGQQDTLIGADQNRITERVQSLRTIAENTDGLAVVSTNDVARGLMRIVDDVSAYYLLGYSSTSANADGRYHRIQVKMKPPGLTVRARRGYTATKMSDRSVSTAADAAVPTEGAISALAKRTAAVDLFVHAVARQREMTAAVEIPSADIAAGRWSQGGDVEITIAGAGSTAAGVARAHLAPGARSISVRIPDLTAEGPWRMTAVLSAGRESVSARLDVTESSGRLVSDASAFRATPAPRSPLRPVADFQYRRAERVHLEWTMASPLDQRQARLLGRNGQPIAVGVTLTERESAGQPTTLAADVTLAPLAEGDYVVELVVGQGATVERQYVAFKIIR